jgi:hypothetical protein
MNLLPTLHNNFTKNLRYTVNWPLFTNICLGSFKFIHLIYRDPTISLETTEYHPIEKKFMFGGN